MNVFLKKEGDAMRRIVINMQNSLFCNAIADTISRSGNELEPYTVASPEKVVDDCKWIAPYAVLMEVTGYSPWKLEERLKIRNAVKENNPECKIVLIVDENAEKAIAKARTATATIRKMFINQRVAILLNFNSKFTFSLPF